MEFPQNSRPEGRGNDDPVIEKEDTLRFAQGACLLRVHAQITIFQVGVLPAVTNTL